jgi:hypothetical protein
MAEEYPYALAPDAFKDFMGKLRTAGKPDKVDKKYLQSLGFKSSNHRQFPGVLQFVGLLDEQGRPTERYRALREGDDGRRKLAGYVKEAYADLFKLYPDADRKDMEALRNFFRARTELGDRAVGAMAVTFQALCGLALFDRPASAPAKEEPIEAARGGEEPEQRLMLTRGGLTINVNIQLELPATTDGDVYERLFSAMARHILKLGEE